MLKRFASIEPETRTTDNENVSAGASVEILWREIGVFFFVVYLLVIWDVVVVK